MKIAPLAVLVAALPLLAQAAEPQASPQERATAAPATEQQQQAAKQKPAKQEPAKQQTEEAAKHRHSWWKNRTPRPVADRTVVRGVSKSAAKPAAKQSAATPAAAKPAASSSPEAEPTPKAKRGVFGALGRVFSGDRQAPATGRATVRRALPAPRDAAAPKAASKATPKPAAKTASPTTRTASASETKKPAAEAPKETAQQVASAPKPAKKAAVSPTPPAPAKPAADDELALPGDTALPQSPSPATPPVPPAATAEFNRKNYLETKQKAAADPAVVALGKKLESAAAGEAHKTAARRYTKALFKKMNELDSSQPEWYQRMEAATIRRIDSGKPIVAE